MLYGEYKHCLDNKNRVRLPRKAKANLGNTFVVTKGTCGCLFVFDKSYWDNGFATKIDSIPTFDSDGQRALRALMSSCVVVEEDAQGRWVLPVSLKDYAQINKNVVIVGVGNRFEIWSEDNWQKYISNVDFDDTTKKLSQFEV